MTKQIATVAGMSCAGCANTVQTKFNGLDNVSDVQVDLDSKTVSINSDGAVSVDGLNQVLEDTPYETTEVKDA